MLFHMNRSTRYHIKEQKNKFRPQTKCFHYRAESKEREIHSGRTQKLYVTNQCHECCTISDYSLIRIYVFCRTEASCCTQEKFSHRSSPVFMRRNLPRSAQVLSAGTMVILMWPAHSSYQQNLCPNHSVDVIFAEFTSFKYSTIKVLDICRP